MSMDNGNNGLLYKTAANTNFELCDNLKFIDVPQTSISQYDEKIKSRQATDNDTSIWKLPYSSTCTSTIRRTEECNIIARSLTELAVGIIPDTRRIRSEPEGLSSTIITKNPKINIIIESKHSTISSASKITSLEKLDSLDIQKSGTTTSQIKIKNDVKTKSVASTIVSPIGTSGPCSKKSSWENSSTENESDYVVDPVQGTAYHKGQFLGKGGFARVYLMTDITNGKKYACKIIPKNRMQKIHIQKIAREIMIHKDLNHVNVVQMHHYFENSLNVYMLLEACPRKSLMHVLKYRGKVTEAEARYYMKQMVTGVAYIHSQHVVHRDLKPGNMFLSDGMIVKIGDFGLATRPDGRKRRVTICGTPNYIAPEVLYKQAYSYEADVWALGCILYALLAGQPPFDTATLRETYSRICNNRYKKLGDSVVSKTGHDLIHWLLQPIPELRPSLERVKEHPYLTAEFVPEKLAHSCCYRIPDLQGMSHLTNSQELLATPSSLPSSSLLSSRSCTSTASRPDLRIHRLNEEPHQQHLSSKLHEMTNGITQRPAILPKPTLTNLTTVKKKSNVGNWLVRKFPKLSKLRHRIGRFLHPDRKKPPESVLMHQALECCLAEIHNTRAASNPLPIDGVVPMFVTKWIDYSNKYGLCFQLSDRSVGVLFNDSTKMSYACDRSRIEYTTPDDEVIRYLRERDVPSSMREKLELLRHFTEYMDEYLTNGGEIGKDYATRMLRRNGNVPRMRRWLRTDKAIVMELTVPLLQVNFFADHTKMVISEGTRPKDYFVTYIDANRHATAYWLNDLRDFGCTAELYERLNYVCKASREFAQLENNAVCCEIPIDNGIVNNKA